MQHQKTLQVGCTTSMTSQRRSPLLNIFLFFIFFFVPSRLFAQHAAYFFSFQIFILCTIGQAPIVIFDLLHFISSTIKKVEESLQIHHTMSFPDFHVDWMSPEEVYLHRENTSSQLYRGNSIHHLRCYLQYVVALLHISSSAIILVDVNLWRPLGKHQRGRRLPAAAARKRLLSDVNSANIFLGGN